jgi:hypothetical protein
MANLVGNRVGVVSRVARRHLAQNYDLLYIGSGGQS